MISINNYTTRLDAAYKGHNHFIRLKARFLLSINLLLFALIFCNLARFLWFPPPAFPVRICINLVIATASIASLRYTWSGKLELGGSVLAIGLALPIHLITIILPAAVYEQPLGSAFQLYVFDTFLLLLALIFATKRTAAICFGIIILGNVNLYLKTLSNDEILGTLRYAADTLARDGIIAFIFFFAAGVIIILILEMATKRSEQSLQYVKAMNARLEAIVSERTKELEEATQKANAATHAKSDFLANMSHEIRTPLFGMIAHAELLEKQGDRFSQKDKEDLRAISNSGDLLLRLINDILDFSKIEAQQLKLESSTFSLSQLMNECISTVVSNAEQKALKISFPQNDTLNISLRGDSHRLKQIILNLLSNAIKFTLSNGEITASAQVLRIEAEKAHIQFAVTDTGIGMDEATKQTIFNRFTQASSSTTRQYGGTGLGLSISSQLVAMMGGQLTAESQKDQGSTFTFSLVFPVVKAKQQHTLPVRNHNSPLGMHVLVVEDNQANQLIIGRQLQTLGCTYQLASNGAEALEILKSDVTIRLILMDNNMPIMDGSGATKIIREWGALEHASPSQRRAAKLPIIVFTANVMNATTFKDKYSHMTDFLIKPLRIKELREMLEKYRFSICSSEVE